MNDLVVLVEEHDNAIGVMDKMEAHEKGLLHRAFSVFIFDTAGRMLLQQRAAIKYHGAGLWTNACCSHPLPGEPVASAAQRRLQEEMGFTTELEKIFSFTYRAEVENNLVEHEYDHVFAGEWEGPVHENENEAAGSRYEEMNIIADDLQQQPGNYTSWFRIAFPRIREWWEGRYGVGSRESGVGSREL